jgi:uncharacterized membrane protein (UPF0127 family)
LKIKHSKSGKLIGSEIKEAKSFMDRTVGLMFKNSMNGYDGLLLSPCPSIHTFFMRFKIDVIFMDKSYSIVKIIRDIKPWRMSRMYFKAYYCLELPSGRLSLEINEGDQLEVMHV